MPCSHCERYQAEIHRLITEHVLYANRLRAILNTPDMPADRLPDLVAERLGHAPH